MQAKQAQVMHDRLRLISSQEMPVLTADTACWMHRRRTAAKPFGHGLGACWCVDGSSAGQGPYRCSWGTEDDGSGLRDGLRVREGHVEQETYLMESGSGTVTVGRCVAPSGCSFLNFR